jgi:hypothetical protein
MARRKTNSIAQVNLRITPQLQHRLAAAALENQVTFSHEVRARLVESLETKSLYAYLADFEAQARDIVEDDVRKDARSSRDIESAFRPSADLHTEIARFQTGVERVLLHHMQNLKLRTLVRGPQQQRGKR